MICSWFLFIQLHFLLPFSYSLLNMLFYFGVMSTIFQTAMLIHPIPHNTIFSYLGLGQVSLILVYLFITIVIPLYHLGRMYLEHCGTNSFWVNAGSSLVKIQCLIVTLTSRIAIPFAHDRFML